MLNHVVKVYDEDLNNAGTAGIVKAQGNMGGLVVRAVAIADKASVAASTFTVKGGEESNAVTTTIGTLSVASSSSAVKEGAVLAEMLLPWNVARYVTATAGSNADTNIRVTLGYLPR